MTGDKIARVAGVAESDKQKSAQQFKQHQLDYEGTLKQLEQLEQFKAEYEAKMETMCEPGMAARQLQDFRCFLGKLNQAIEQQLQEVQNSRETLDSAREQWTSKARRSSALDQVVDQQQLRRRQELDRTEQRESDEKAMARAGSLPGS